MLGDDLEWIKLIFIGCASGFVSGLLGIGGGVIIVPALILTLPHFGVSGPDIPKIAMGTSLALVVPTSIASAQAHAIRDAIDWPLLGLLAPAIIAGAFSAAFLVPSFSTYFVVLLFVTFAIVSSCNLLRHAEEPTFNGSPLNAAAIGLKGAIGGGISAILGIGGAFFTIPILLRFIPMQRAIGTAAALAIPLSFAGSAGYLLAETPSGCGQGCVGYIFFPAVAAVGISAVLAAPLGAWLTYCAPVIILKRLFAFLLLCAAGNLAFKTFSPALPTPREAVASATVSPVKMSPPVPMRKAAAGYRSAPPADFGTGEPPEPAEPASIFPPPPSWVGSPAPRM